MPQRAITLANDQIYHVYNKSINRTPVFINNKVCQRALIAVRYYRSQYATHSLSHFLKMNTDEKTALWLKIDQDESPLVQILSYALMPTHYHFLLKQKQKGGITKFIANVVNSITKYFNSFSKRIGPLMLPCFKCVRIVSETQLMHTSRYIHLNPFSNGRVANLQALENYPWSSYREYVYSYPSDHPQICLTKTILSLFNQDRNQYKQFVSDQADYQKHLEELKYADLPTKSHRKLL